MKRMIVKMLLSVLLMFLFFGMNLEKAFANSYQDGEMIIEVFTTGSLENAINVDYNSITSLVVVEGIINADDCSWIRDNLVNVQVLEISGNAEIHSTSDVLVGTPDNRVPAEAFSEMESLIEVKMTPVIAIGSRAFFNCGNLTDINITAVEFIDSEAFKQCALKNVTLGSTVPVLSDNVFSDMSSVEPTIKIPDGSESSYKGDTSDGDSTDNAWYGFTIYVMSNDATLSDLSISEGTLEPMFNSSITDYKIGLANDIESIEVTPTLNSTNARVSVNGEAVTNGAAKTVLLSVGQNEISIETTAEDNSILETRIIVTRAAASNGEFSGGNGTDTSPFEIISAEQLDNVRNHLDSFFVLKSDIDLSGYDNWQPIGSSYGSSFTGYFNGNGYKITNLKIDRETENYTGLFGVNSGTIKNTNLINVDIKVVAVGNAFGADVGAMVGVNSGTIDNCKSSGTVIGRMSTGGLVGNNTQDALIKNCYSSANVEGSYQNAGGLAGRNSNGSIIQNSYSIGTVKGDKHVGGLVGNSFYGSVISYCYSTGNVTGNENVGGLVGRNYYNNSSINYCFSTGTVEGVTNPGGLVGNNYDSGTVENSYYDTETSGQSDTGKGEPKTTKAMNEPETYLTWDFINLWEMADGATYPEFIDFKPHDATLKDLRISSGDLVPSFNRTEGEYTVNVPFSMSSIGIIPIASNNATPGSTILVEGVEVESGDSIDIQLDVGANKIVILVTSEDEMTTTQIEVVVTRAISNDASLSNLVVSPGVLTSRVDSDPIDYFLDVTYSISSVMITPTASYSTGANIMIEGNDVVSGETFEVPLNVGANIINIVVTAHDGITTDETVLLVMRNEKSSGGNSSSYNSSHYYMQSKQVEEADFSIASIHIITEKIFNELKEDGIKHTMNGNLYRWKFEELTNSDELDIDFDKGDGLIINTIYEGKLPVDAKFSFKVDNFENNQLVYLYKYDDAISNLEFVEALISQNGEVELNISHCSIYVVSRKPMLIDDYKSATYIKGYSDGTFRPDESLTRAETVAMLSNLLISNSAKNTSAFTDIDMWAKESITKLTSLKLINGYSDGTFRPNHSITRAELAVILSKSLGLGMEIGEERFNDIKGHWAQSAICALQNAGIVSGYNDGSFKPDDVVTRAEAVTMINKALNKVTTINKIFKNPFSDLSQEHWAFESIMSAIEQ